MRSVFPNIRHMRVFVAAADTDSVSAAADRCHLSQPAATQAITQLEKRSWCNLNHQKTSAIFLDDLR